MVACPYPGFSVASVYPDCLYGILGPGSLYLFDFLAEVKENDHRLTAETIADQIMSDRASK